MINESNPLIRSDKFDKIIDTILKVQKSLTKFSATAQNAHLKNKYAPLEQMQDELNAVLKDANAVWTCGPLANGIVYGLYVEDQYELRWTKLPPFAANGVNEYKGAMTATNRYAMRFFFNLSSGDPDLDNIETTHPDKYNEFKINNADGNPWANLLDKAGNLNKDTAQKIEKFNKSLSALNEVVNLSKVEVTYLRKLGWS